MEAPSEPQVLVIGEGFIAGQAGNADIDLMLGYKTVLCGDRAVREDDSGGYSVAPDYCEKEELTTGKLAEFGIYPLLLQTESTAKRKPKDFVSEWVAVIAFGGDTAITKPFEKRSHALACALWFALADK